MGPASAPQISRVPRDKHSPLLPLPAASSLLCPGVQAQAVLAAGQLLGGCSEVSLEPSLPQAEEPQLCQPVLPAEVPQPLDHLRGLPWTLSIRSRSFLCWGLQSWTQQCRCKGSWNPLPGLPRAAAAAGSQRGLQICAWHREGCPGTGPGSASPENIWSCAVKQAPRSSKDDEWHRGSLLLPESWNLHSTLELCPSPLHAPPAPDLPSSACGEFRRPPDLHRVVSGLSCVLQGCSRILPALLGCCLSLPPPEPPAQPDWLLLSLAQSRECLSGSDATAELIQASSRERERTAGESPGEAAELLRAWSSSGRSRG
ncbi:uncharacterized protein [Melanerpes formicivorus]|uniref:uncharacterized protein n=1 Tax=Melanerpes formicivorus TaxID=211600 RepID=UPI00358E568E